MQNITQNNNVTSSTFTELGKPFQEKVMQALIVDRAWAASFIEVFDLESCFEFAYLKLVGRIYIDYFAQYKEFPSMGLMIPLVQNALANSADAGLRDQVINFLAKVGGNRELGDLGWVKDTAYKFCRSQTIKKAIIESADMVDDESRYEVIVETVKKAICAGIPTSPGLDYNNDIDARYSETYRRTIATNLKELDDRKILNGGLGGGEIGIIVAPTGVGKTHALVHLGAQALLQKKNVVHFSLELNERVTGIRYDSHLTQIASTDCVDNKEVIRQFFQENKLGALRIKLLPARSTTVNTLRAYLDKLKMQQDFKADMVIVDYAGIMRSTSKYELMRLELKEIIQELRDYAVELDVPLWTALQSNKEGSNSDYVDLSNMAESYAQAHIADVVLGISRKSAVKSTGMGNLFIAKNRAGMDGVQFKIHLDTARSTMRILSEAEVEDMAVEVEKNYNKSPFSSQVKGFMKGARTNGDMFHPAVPGGMDGPAKWNQ